MLVPVKIKGLSVSSTFAKIVCGRAKPHTALQVKFTALPVPPPPLLEGNHFAADEGMGEKVRESGAKLSDRT